MTADHAAGVARNWLGAANLLPPDGRRFWLLSYMVGHDEKTGEPKPSFGTNTVAVVFFGRSAAWLRVRLRPSADYPHSRLALDGRPLQVYLSRSKDRKFSLLDIERAAHALIADGSLDQDRFTCTMALVIWCARQWKMLPFDMPADAP
jgi:hypothetical protein